MDGASALSVKANPGSLSVVSDSDSLEVMDAVTKNESVLAERLASKTCWSFMHLFLLAASFLSLLLRSAVL